MVATLHVDARTPQQINSEYALISRTHSSTAKASGAFLIGLGVAGAIATVAVVASVLALNSSGHCQCALGMSARNFSIITGTTVGFLSLTAITAGACFVAKARKDEKKSDELLRQILEQNEASREKTIIRG